MTFPGDQDNALAGPRRVLLERVTDEVVAFAVYHYLDANGVPVTLNQRPLRTALGEIPFLEAASELYLEDAERLAEALELLRRYHSGYLGVRGTTWECGHCGETHEPEFGACWMCGRLRP